MFGSNPLDNISHYNHDNSVSKEFAEYFITSASTRTAESLFKPFPDSLRNKLFYNTSITETSKSISEFCRIGKDNEQTYKMAQQVTQCRKFYENFYIFYGCSVCLEYNFEKLTTPTTKRNLCDLCLVNYKLNNDVVDVVDVPNITLTTSPYPTMLLECIPTVEYDSPTIALEVANFMKIYFLVDKQVLKTLMLIRQNIFTTTGESKLFHLANTAYAGYINDETTNDKISRDGNGWNGENGRDGGNGGNEWNGGNGGDTTDLTQPQSKLQKLSQEMHEKLFNDYYLEERVREKGLIREKGLVRKELVEEELIGEDDTNNPIYLKIREKMKDLCSWVTTREHVITQKKKCMEYVDKKNPENLDETIKYYGYHDESLVIPDEYKHLFEFYVSPKTSKFLD